MQISRLLLIKLTEISLFFVTVLTIFWFTGSQYWPGRTRELSTLLIGSGWLALTYFVLWGYLFVSLAVLYFVGRATSGSTLWLGLAGAVVFAVHSFTVMTLLHFKMDAVLWLVWAFVIVANAILPLLIIKFLRS